MTASASEGNENYLLLPPNCYNFDGVTEVIISNNCYNADLNYFAWIQEVKKLAEKIKPDVVHFLTGDIFYRYFGLGLRSLKKKYPILITLHQIRRSTLRDISLKCISNSADILVVHTEKIQSDLKKMGIYNTRHIEYPRFNTVSAFTKGEAFSMLANECPKQKVLLALGATREEKGLDILLKALRKVEAPFYLIIAGAEDYYTRDFIEREINSYRENVLLILDYLSELMFAACINASDIIVLPYKKSFDGASGPLGEGVWLSKEIIGANHGSLGRIIEDNHLGYTFESENSDSLASVLNCALISDFKIDNKFEKYRISLNAKYFQQSYVELYNGFMLKDRKSQTDKK